MQNQRQSLSVPIAIVIAGALVGFGIYWAGRGTTAPATAKAPAADAGQVTIQPIQPGDHVLGNPKAKIVIVEYSDTECPYCKQFHATLHQLVTTYSGQVAWVYRHLPAHQRSLSEGEATECAAAQGGNDAFWKYIDQVYATTNSNDTLDPAALPQIAAAVGLDGAKLSSCVASGTYESLVTEQGQDAMNSGALGTPYSVIFASGQTIPITQGALPYLTMKSIVDAILKNS